MYSQFECINLTPVYRSFESGGRMFERYKSIVGGDDDAHVPFVRAASAERCVDSARNWTAGEFVRFLGFTNATSCRQRFLIFEQRFCKSYPQPCHLGRRKLFMFFTDCSSCTSR